MRNEFSFLPKSNKYKLAPFVKFWNIDKHDIPESGGVYILIASPRNKFIYPEGKSFPFVYGVYLSFGNSQ